MLPATNIKITEKRNKRFSTESLHFIFLKTSTGKPHTDSKEIHKLWSAHLRKSGLRHRGINQCRHTFVSRLLTTGKYPEKWIANYLGHTTTAMLHKHYGKFIEIDAPDLESQASEDLRIFEPALNKNNEREGKSKEKQNFVPIAAQNKIISKKSLKINRLNGGERGIRTRRSNYAKYTYTYPHIIINNLENNMTSRYISTRTDFNPNLTQNRPQLFTTKENL